MKVILFTVAGVQPMIGTVIKEDEEFMNVEYPVVIMKDDPYLFTMPYIPFAKGGMVAFNKINIISVASVDDEVLEFYKTVVSEMKESKISFKKPSESKKEVVIKQKHLH
jgi:hypothetical protein